MSEEMEPVAQAPEFGGTVETAPAAEINETASHAAGLKKWPVAIVAGIAIAAGIGGYALGVNGTGGVNVNTVGDHRGFGPDGQMGPQGKPGQQGQFGPQGGMRGGGQGMMQGNGQQGQMPMGPHCEDTTGNHAAVNADGSCPTGYTLDDKGRGGMGNGQGMMGNGLPGQPGQGVDPDGDNWTGTNKQAPLSTPSA